MIRINLLPYREREKKENILRQVVVMAGCLVLFLAVLAGLTLYLENAIGGLETRIKESQARLALLNKKVGDIEAFKRDKKELEQKLSVIGALEGDRLFAVQLLDEINVAIPAGEAWLEKIVQNGPEVRLEGVARDNGTVAKFMASLEKTALFKAVDLVVSKEKVVSGANLQQFTVLCLLKKER